MNHSTSERGSMNAADVAPVFAHWFECRRRALAEAAEATRNRCPALRLLRESSRCEARITKLVRLVEKASLPRSAS
jgi:hypothetical protein